MTRAPHRARGKERGSRREAERSTGATPPRLGGATSPRSGGTTSPRLGGAPPARPSAWRRAVPAIIALVLVLGGARALFSLLRHPAPAPPPAPAALDPAAGMTTAEAAQNAARLYRESLPYQSLPFYRRVAPEMPPGRLDFGIEFATALESAALQAPIQSEERVRLMMECLDRLGRTEVAMRTPRDRAEVIVTRAFFLRVWGFPLDAVTELRRARETDPSYPDIAATLRAMERRVHEPTLPLDALDTESPPAR
jgi:hypothetical protein